MWVSRDSETFTVHLRIAAKGGHCVLELEGSWGLRISLMQRSMIVQNL